MSFRMSRIIPLGGLMAMLSGCSDKWEGFVYPNRSDLTVHIGIGSYESLDSCRASALKAISVIKQVRSGGRITLDEALGTEVKGDYECGLNCESVSGFSGRVCEETVR